MWIIHYSACRNVFWAFGKKRKRGKLIPDIYYSIFVMKLYFSFLKCHERIPSEERAVTKFTTNVIFGNFSHK